MNLSQEKGGEMIVVPALLYTIVGIWGLFLLFLLSALLLLLFSRPFGHSGKGERKAATFPPCYWKKEREKEGPSAGGTQKPTFFG